MGQPVNPQLLPWVLLSVCNDSALVGLSTGAWKCQDPLGSGEQMVVSAQLFPSGKLSPALSDRREF